MTPEQYDRWKDFALRAARTWYKTHRRPNVHWIVDVVEDFFDSLPPEDIVCIVSWDHSDDYPPGHPCHGVESHWQCNYRGGPPCGKDGCENGQHARYAHPYGVGDMMTEFLDHDRGYAPSCRTCREDGAWGDSECKCEGIERLHYEQWDDQWGGPVRCCIRAGLDLTAVPSGGVIGFTAGDLRAMYPEGVPDWVKGDEPWPSVPIVGVVPGVGFVPGEAVPNGTFDEMPDDAQVWL